MNKVKITAIIPTKNEEDNIEAAIKSVSFADEIIVVDSFSTDRTVEIARKYADKVVQHEYINSAAQKNWIIPQAKNEWIIILDADERITPQLRDEILHILSRPTEYVAFWIGRINYFMGKRIRFGGWGKDKVIRLFRKSKCRYENKHVHAEIIADGKVGKLKNKIIHYTYKNFNDYYSKLLKYSTWGAKDRLNKIDNVGFFYLSVKPFLSFINVYIFRLGFLDGKVGFILAKLLAHYVFLRYLKIWLMKRGEKFD